MKRRALLLMLAGVGLYASVAALPASGRRPFGEHARALSRPLVLPGLWARLQTAERTGDVGEAVAVGRLITALLPEWVDGRVHFAWRLAAHSDRAASSPQEALDRLDAAADLLDAGAAELASRRPSLTAELLMAKATIVESRCIEDPELGAAFRARHGRDPLDLAHAAIAAATAVAPSDVKQDLLAHLTVRLVAGALRMRDVGRASRTLALARRRLTARLPDRRARAELESLDRLDPFETYLRDPERIDELAADPAFRDVARALRALVEPR